MNAPLIMSTMLIGQLLIGGPLAAQSPGPIMLIQAAPPQEAASDRMMRLRQNRAILENALRAQPQEPPQATPQEPPQAPMPAAPEADIQPEEQGMTAETPAPVSCEAAAAIVADYGFSDIQATDCAGELYRFSATRDGTAYSIAITAAAGEIAEVNRQ